MSAGEPLLLTDGTVIVHSISSGNWKKLTPTNTGDYRNGTWSNIASMPSGYGPLYFASAVLADGRVIVQGGEYNFGSGVWTNLGAIYNPQTNTWASLSAPPGWANIGDAQCAVMPDGRYMLAMPFDTRMAILNPTTMAWTNLNSTGKIDRHDEEGWTLLPDGTILTVDAINAPHCEKYIPALDQWLSAGNTPNSLEDPGSQEIGPAVLMTNGKVFATGATGFNAVYTPGSGPNDPGTWVSAPKFPVIGGQLDIADGPACLLPNGKVLCDASPGIFNSPSHFFEFDGTTLTQVASTPNSTSNPSYVGNMLVLPNGQVLFTDFTNDVEIYTPTGGPNNAWRPTISSCPTAITAGQTFVIGGTQFNGLSQCNAYGDDSSNATNYPLVRITNATTGHVFYCRTFNHSTMAVATGSLPTTTNVAVPSGIESGVSTVEVVANGIPSLPVEVLVGGALPTITSVSPTSVQAPSGAFTLTVNGTEYMATDTVQWTMGTTTLLSTTKVSVTKLTATVPSSLVQEGGTATIRVKRADGTLSNSATVSVLNPAPALTSLSPNTVTAGSGGFTLTVNGSGFVSGSTVRWNGATRTTTFVNTGQLQAAILPSDVASVGTGAVTVLNAAPGGGTSNTLNVSVVPIEVTPNAFTFAQGSLNSGALSDLANSDDHWLKGLLFFGVTRTSPNLTLDVTGATTSSTVTRLDVSVESSANHAGMTQKLYAFDYVLNDWVLVDTVTLTTADQTRTVSITTNASRYLSGGQVKCRVSLFDPASLAAMSLGNFDRVHWSLYP